MNYLEHLERMLDANFRIISIETYDPERVEELFTQLSRFSSKPFYLYQGEEGLHRIGASHIKIPRTQAPLELARHILKNTHYGVYIIRNFNPALTDKSVVQTLKQIATEKTNKVVVLLSEYIDLPEDLKPFTLRSKHQMRKAI